MKAAIIRLVIGWVLDWLAGLFLSKPPMASTGVRKPVPKRPAEPPKSLSRD